MDATPMSPADYAAMAGNDGFGGNFLAMIFLFALIFGFNGNGWGGNNLANAIGYENLATSNEVQRGFDNQNSMANQRDILAAVNQNYHDVTQYVGDRYGELQRDIAGVSMGVQQAIANQNECCCSTKMLISETAANQRYESAMQNNATIQAIQAEGAATRQMIQQNKIETLQQQVQQLQLAQAMNGVVRYPDSFAYNAGANPFCNCGGYNI